MRSYGQPFQPEPVFGRTCDAPFPSMVPGPVMAICFASSAQIRAALRRRGRASVLIPYPTAAENHQYHNAMVLGKAGAAVVIEQKDLPFIRRQRRVNELPVAANAPEIYVTLAERHELKLRHIPAAVAAIGAGDFKPLQPIRSAVVCPAAGYLRQFLQIQFLFVIHRRVPPILLMNLVKSPSLSK